MNFSKQLATWAVALAAAASTSAAIAVPVAYSFTATAGSTGPLSGQVFAGTFWVDSAAVAAGQGVIDDLAFNFLGIVYTEDDHAWGTPPTSAQFAADGSLTRLDSLVVLSPARVAAALLNPALARPMNSPATSFSFSSGTLNYGSDAYRGETHWGNAQAFSGQAIAAVPEPASLALVATALLGLCLRRRAARPAPLAHAG